MKTKSFHAYSIKTMNVTASHTPLRWRHNGRDGVSNHQPHDRLLNRYSGADQIKHQSSASLAFVRGIHRSPVNSPHKWPVTRKSFHLMTSSWPKRQQTWYQLYIWWSDSWFLMCFFCGVCNTENNLIQIWTPLNFIMGLTRWGFDRIDDFALENMHS